MWFGRLYVKTSQSESPLLIAATDGSFPQQVESVKVVEYVGSESCEGYFPVTGCRVVINTYCWMDHRDPNMKRDVQEELLLDFATLPSLQFDGYWERLDRYQAYMLFVLTIPVSFTRQPSKKTLSSA